MKSEIPYRIRPAILRDLPRVRTIYDSAKAYMNISGNPNQWVVGYPPEDMLTEDIAQGTLYVLCDTDDLPHAVFAVIPGADPTYAVIDGQWRNDRPYVAVHRVASDGTFRGVVTKITAFARERHPSLDIRIDTHADNRPMQQALTANGYVLCGIIHLSNGDPRNAYQLL